MTHPMEAQVLEAIKGLDITTIRWEQVEGMRLNFKVFCSISLSSPTEELPQPDRVIDGRTDDSRNTDG